MTFEQDKFRVAEIAGWRGQIADDDRDTTRDPTSSSDYSHVADVRVGQGDDLLQRWNFLIAGQCGVEHHLAGGNTFRTNTGAAKNTAVSQCQQSGFSSDLSHAFLVLVFQAQRATPHTR